MPAASPRRSSSETTRSSSSSLLALLGPHCHARSDNLICALGLRLRRLVGGAADALLVREHERALAAVVRVGGDGHAVFALGLADADLPGRELHLRAVQ